MPLTITEIAIMFYNFCPSQGLPTPKRRKVNRACDFCREHRVRCEAATPCTQCVSNNVLCIRPTPAGAPTSSYHRIDPVPDGLAAEDQDLSQCPRQVAEPKVHTPNINITPPRQHDSASTHRTDSMLGFIARMDAFCSGVSQLSSTSPSDPPPPYTSPFPPSALQESSPAECNLSSAQVERLLRIFWARLRPQVPIVRREDLLSSNSSSHPLRDAITAYSMQHVYYSGLNTRLLGLQWPQLNRGGRSSMVGMPYFQRCLAAVTQYWTFAGPSLLVLQCYCFMTLYLLDAGQHHAAYNMIGLAVRIAQSLNLHIDPPPGTPHEEAQLSRRIWWTLIHLDFRCSRHLGKPVGIRLHDTMCSPPTRDLADLISPESYSYHSESVRLTAAALAVLESTSCHPPPSARDTLTSHSESRAKLLSEELRLITQWRTDLLQDQSLRHLNLDVGDTPADPNEDPEDTGDYLRQLPLEILLTTLLELQYHDVVISLHRVFIQFPSHPLQPKSSPRVDAHGATALNHALASIKTVHRRLSENDILYGCCELYQYQWNAVLTLIGFMLAYPYCYRFQRARAYIKLAMEVFESAGSQNVAAVRAASLTRHLCQKVDTLVRILNIRERPGPGAPMVPDTAASAESVVEKDAVQSSCREDAVDSSIPPYPGPMGDDLWSWVDLINADAWPSYCDEVNEVFAEGNDLFAFQEGL